MRSSLAITILTVLVLAAVATLGIQEGYSCGTKKIAIHVNGNYDSLVYIDRMWHKNELSSSEAYEVGSKPVENCGEISTCRKTIWFYGIEIWQRNIYPHPFDVVVKAGESYKVYENNLGKNDSDVYIDTGLTSR